MFRGYPAFLIAGGPSFLKADKSKLSYPGVLTMGMNNVVKTFRTHLWTSVDNPTHFIKSIWLDPTIMKFVPFCHSEKFIFDNESWEETQICVGDCPHVWFYRRNEHFNAKQFLFEDTINWGNHKKYGGGRSVMLPAIRLLYYLGVRHIFLLGVDFKINKEYTYSFEQARSKGSVNSNNKTYKLLIERFTMLIPIFKQNGLNIYNCNLESELKVFPFVKFDDAVNFATSKMPCDVKNERTAGLYDRKAKLKNTRKNTDNAVKDSKTMKDNHEFKAGDKIPSKSISQ